jgi:alpha-glucuronidase
VSRHFSNLDTVGDDQLLWFHHVPWTMRLDTGRTVWAELVHRYDRGVAAFAAMQRSWAVVAPSVDAERAAQVSRFLTIQRAEAQWWRDASVAYFQNVSRLPLRINAAPPAAH